MADAQSTFTIFLKTIADATGISQIKTNVQSLNEQTIGLKNTLVGLGAGATGFLAIDEAVKGLRKGFELIEEAIKHAAAEEEAAFSLRKLIGDADLAEAKLKELIEFKREAGIFTFSELAEGAKSLLLIGTGTENLIPRLRSMSEIAAVTGDNVTSVVAAYQRLRFAIERGTEPMIRGMAGMGTAVITLIRSLMDETGRTEGEVLKMFRDRTISIDLLHKALADATTGTGRYANSIVEKAATMRGAIKLVENTWHSLQNALGEPIREALTPLLTQFAEKLKELRPFFAEIGQRIGDIAKAFTRIAQEEGWKTAIKAAWDVLVAEIGAKIEEGIRAAFAHAITGGFVKDLVEKLQGIGKGIRDTIFPQFKEAGEAGGDGLAAGIRAKKDVLQAAVRNALQPLKGEPIVEIGTSKTVQETKDIETAFRGVGNAAKEAADKVAIAKDHMSIAEEHYRVELERVKLLEDQGAISVAKGDALRVTAGRQYVSNLQEIIATLRRLQSQLSPTSKAWQEVQLAIEKATLADLRAKGEMANAGPFGKIRSQLVQLKNEWGDIGKQFGGFLVNQFQNFASTMGNAIGALVFRTGNLKQAILQLGQAFVSQLATMVIQWILSQTILKALSAAFQTEQAAQAQVAAAPVQAAWAGAAVNASIATFGAAAIEGSAAYLAAFFATAGIGAAAKFRLGGFTGEGRDDEPAGLVHRGEFVISAPRTRALGRGFLEMLHGGIGFARPFQGGGFAGPGSGGTPVGAGTGSGDVHVFIFDDLRKAIAAHNKSSAGRKEFRIMSRKNKI